MLRTIPRLNGGGGGGGGGVAMKNFFSVLGIPERFDVDSSSLRKRYKSLMVENHPDRFAASGGAAPKDPSLITTAYQTIGKPHLRASHLLELGGNELSEDNQQNVLPMEFLMEIMEVREALSEIDADDEASGDRLRDMKENNDERVKEVIERLSVAFEGGDVDAARENTAILNYYHRIEEEIKEKECVE